MIVGVYPRLFAAQDPIVLEVWAASEPKVNWDRCGPSFLSTLQERSERVYLKICRTCLKWSQESKYNRQSESEHVKDLKADENVAEKLTSNFFAIIPCHPLTWK